MMATARHPDHEAGAAQGGWRREDHHERAGDRDDTGRHPRPPSPVTGARAIREIADERIRDRVPYPRRAEDQAHDERRDQQHSGGELHHVQADQQVHVARADAGQPVGEDGGARQAPRRPHPGQAPGGCAALAHRNPYAWAGSQMASASQLKMMARPTSWMTMNGTTPR